MPKKHSQSLKTRKRTGKNLDEIIEDQKPHKAARLAAERAGDLDPDLPGDGQFFCTPCDRHFVDSGTLSAHSKTKGHRQRLKALREKPYTQAEAEAAAGIGSYSNSKMGSIKTDELREVKKKPTVMEVDSLL